jgi:hypothetical protein
VVLTASAMSAVSLQAEGKPGRAQWTQADGSQVATIVTFYQFLQRPIGPTVAEAATVLGGLREMEEGMPSTACGRESGRLKGSGGTAEASLVFCCLRKQASIFNGDGPISMSWPPQVGADGLKQFRVSAGAGARQLQFEFSQSEKALDNIYLSDGRTLPDLLQECIGK